MALECAGRIGKARLAGGDCLAYGEKERAATLERIALRILASFPFSHINISEYLDMLIRKYPKEKG